MGVPQYDRRKFGWLDRMMFDITLSPTARLVGFALYRHLNDVSGDAWPSQETIRRKLGIGNIRHRARSREGALQSRLYRNHLRSSLTQQQLQADLCGR
jgi:hypothetical protein